MNESSTVPPALANPAEHTEPVASAARTSRVAPFLFPLAIAFLAVVALLATFIPAKRVSGLPDDPDVQAARALVHDRLAVHAGGLRFTSALLGDGDSAAAKPALADAMEAARRLEVARARHPLDARIQGSLAALDLATLRLESAQRRYRAALDLAPAYAEARLGLGVVLAIRAGTDPDLSRAQRTRLQAISQLAAVDAGAPEYRAALYDRAIVLARAGRDAEARRLADAYRRLDPGRWADALDEAIRHPAE